MNRKKRFAELLVQIKALQLNVDTPFKWTSGWFSPVYCDNRQIYNYPALRKEVVDLLCELITEEFSGDKSTIVFAGVSTAGIAIGVLVADHFNAPYISVRSAAKDHGMKSPIDGVVPVGKKVIVIEDLISTGKSSLEVVRTLQEVGAHVLCVCALFTYGFPVAEKAFADAGMSLYTVSDYTTLLEVGKDQELIQPDHEAMLKEWQQNPSAWRQVNDTID